MPVRAPVDPRQRALGAWSTPPALVEHLLDVALEPALDRALDPARLRVLDPACGDGRILAAAARRLVARRVPPGVAARCVHGVDVDPAALAAARRVLGPRAHLFEGDATEASLGRFDVVLGNPPFLSQLAAATSRGGRSRHGGGPYADAAAVFLSLALEWVRPGGWVGLVLPASFLGARDAQPVRDHVLDAGALRHLWWSERPVFDAAVATVVVVVERGGVRRPVTRSAGLPARPLPPVDPPEPGRSWGRLAAAGVPPVALHGDGTTLGDRAEVVAGFRDEFYGLVGHVREGGRGPRLVTAGLLDPGHVAWGERAARFAGGRYERPVVDLAGVRATAPSVARALEAAARPKVLVASQTAIVEAAVDASGRFAASVPVLSVLPRRQTDLWAVGAALSAPGISAHLAAECWGTGRSRSAIRVSAPLLRALPWPAGDLAPAAEVLRAGDLAAAGRLAGEAYGSTDEALFGWWWAAVSASRARRATRRPAT